MARRRIGPQLDIAPIAFRHRPRGSQGLPSGGNRVGARSSCPIQLGFRDSEGATVGLGRLPRGFVASWIPEDPIREDHEHLVL